MQKKIYEREKLYNQVQYTIDPWTTGPFELHGSTYTWIFFSINNIGNFLEICELTNFVAYKYQKKLRNCYVCHGCYTSLFYYLLP